MCKTYSQYVTKYPEVLDRNDIYGWSYLYILIMYKINRHFHNFFEKERENLKNAMLKKKEHRTYGSYKFMEKTWDARMKLKKRAKDFFFD